MSQRFKYISGYLCCFGLRWGRMLWRQGQGRVKQLTSWWPGSREHNQEQHIPSKGTPLVTYFLSSGPGPYFPSPPNNTIKFWIYQWINPLMKTEPHYPITSHKPHQMGFWGTFQIQTICLWRGLLFSLYLLPRHEVSGFAPPCTSTITYCLTAGPKQPGHTIIDKNLQNWAKNKPYLKYLIQ